MMPGYGYMGGWGWIVMSLSTLVFLALIALVVWLVARTASGGNSRQDSGAHSARQILAERYARGEIDEQEIPATAAHPGRLKHRPEGGLAPRRARPSPFSLPFNGSAGGRCTTLRPVFCPASRSMERAVNATTSEGTKSVLPPVLRQGNTVQT